MRGPGEVLKVEGSGDLIGKDRGFWGPTRSEGEWA